MKIYFLILTILILGLTPLAADTKDVSAEETTAAVDSAAAIVENGIDSDGEEVKIETFDSDEEPESSAAPISKEKAISE